MKLLNVIDLDKTLITIDSLRYLVLKKMNPAILLIAILRVLKIIDRSKFAEKVSQIFKDVLHDECQMESLVKYLQKKVNKKVLEKVQEHSEGDAVTVIVSASPEEYVKKFAEYFGFLGIGSHWRADKYFHCYGTNKITYIEQKFPKEKYRYNFAISDNKNDIELLSLFEMGVLYENPD